MATMNETARETDVSIGEEDVRAHERAGHSSFLTHATSSLGAGVLRRKLQRRMAHRREETGAQRGGEEEAGGKLLAEANSEQPKDDATIGAIEEVLQTGWFDGIEGAAPEEGVEQTLHAGHDAEVPTPHDAVHPVNREDPNGVLFSMTTHGASQQTADSDGLHAGRRASRKMARKDLKYMMKHQMRGHLHWFRDIGVQHNIPPALLAAIASRESRGGSALDAKGNSHDPDNNGYGLMQIDRGYHHVRGAPYSYTHIEQAALILRRFLNQVKERHPTWSRAWKLRGMLVAYNSGIDNVQSESGIDKGTTGNDYSSDIWERARYLAKHHPVMLGAG